MPTDASIFIATAQWCQFVLNMLRSIDQFLHKKEEIVFNLTSHAPQVFLSGRMNVYFFNMKR